MDRQRVMRSAGPWRDVGRHFASNLELRVSCLREQRDYQVLQRDNADPKLHQLGICQLRNPGFQFAGTQDFLRTLRHGATLVLPS